MQAPPWSLVGVDPWIERRPSPRIQRRPSARAVPSRSTLPGAFQSLQHRYMRPPPAHPALLASTVAGRVGERARRVDVPVPRRNRLWRVIPHRPRSTTLAAHAIQHLRYVLEGPTFLGRSPPSRPAPTTVGRIRDHSPTHSVLYNAVPASCSRAATVQRPPQASTTSPASAPSHRRAAARVSMNLDVIPTPKVYAYGRALLALQDESVNYNARRARCTRPPIRPRLPTPRTTFLGRSPPPRAPSIAVGCSRDTSLTHSASYNAVPASRSRAATVQQPPQASPTSPSSAPSLWRAAARVSMYLDVTRTSNAPVKHSCTGDTPPRLVRHPSRLWTPPGSASTTPRRVQSRPPARLRHLRTARRYRDLRAQPRRAEEVDAARSTTYRARRSPSGRGRRRYLMHRDVCAARVCGGAARRGRPSSTACGAAALPSAQDTCPGKVRAATVSARRNGLCAKYHLLVDIQGCAFRAGKGRESRVEQGGNVPQIDRQGAPSSFLRGAEDLASSVEHGGVDVPHSGRHVKQLRRREAPTSTSTSAPAAASPPRTGVPRTPRCRRLPGYTLRTRLLADPRPVRPVRAPRTSSPPSRPPLSTAPAFPLRAEGLVPARDGAMSGREANAETERGGSGAIPCSAGANPPVRDVATRAISYHACAARRSAPPFIGRLAACNLDAEEFVVKRERRGRGYCAADVLADVDGEAVDIVWQTSHSTRMDGRAPFEFIQSVSRINVTSWTGSKQRTDALEVDKFDASASFTGLSRRIDTACMSQASLCKAPRARGSAHFDWSARGVLCELEIRFYAPTLRLHVKAIALELAPGFGQSSGHFQQCAFCVLREFAMVLNQLAVASPLLPRCLSRSRSRCVTGIRSGDYGGAHIVYRALSNGFELC
ncbi:hypothetical protein VTO73DRAFT_11499 [Trametes versicolor]